MHWNVKCCCSLWLIIGLEDKSEKGILSQGVGNEAKLSQTLLSENMSAVVMSLTGRGTSQGCTDSGSQCWFMCRLFPSFGHRMHLKMFQMCKSNTLDFTHLASAAFCKRNQVQQFNSEAIFKSNLAHVSRCIFPPPRHEPQTTQQRGFPYWIDYITKSENHLPLCPHTNTYTPRLSCAKWPTVFYKENVFIFMFTIGFSCHSHGLGFHSYKYSHLLYNTALLLNSQKATSNSTLFSMSLKFENYWGKIGPGWGYVIYSINCLHQPAYWLNHWQSSAPEMEPDEH